MTGRVELNETPAELADDDDEPIWPSRAQTACGKAHAGALMEQARAGGLRFEAYLTSRTAEWVLGLIEKGTFCDPAEAVFVFFDEMQRLYDHPDLRRELLRRVVQAAADDPRPGIPAQEVFAHLEAEMAKPRPEPAVWQKMPPEDDDL